MNDRQITPQATVTEEVFQSPQFRLVPLHVAHNIRPRRYRPLPEGSLERLHNGSYIKVLAAHAGDIGTREEIWLIIRHLSPLRNIGKHIGEVVYPAKPGTQDPAPMAKWHGLDRGMLIYFQMADVIDMQLRRVDTP